ncbi:MAG: VWA domain-containing protein [Pseudomonadota bacterium]
MTMPILPQLELREPAFLLLGILAVPLFLLVRRAGGRAVFSSFRLLPPASSRSLRLRLAWIPPGLLSATVVLLAIALAGPRVGDRKTRVERRGIAIMMVVDISGSMRALDLSDGDRERTRLDATREVFRAFVLGEGSLPGRQDDSIGLVAFARYADCRCPLTLDHDSLGMVASRLAIVTEEQEDGTALGDGLGLALERLRGSPVKSKVAILLTDGVNNTGEMAPLQTAQLAQTLGIKIYTIGAGTNGFAPVRVEDPLGRSVLTQTRVEIDEATLQAIAERTGGRYFRATDGEALRRVYEEIDRLERTDVSEERFVQYREYFGIATAAALALACAAWLLGGTVFRRLP